MTRNTGPTPATVNLVWERDQGRCARCGTYLRRDERGQSWSIHHRRARGMGGSRLLFTNLPGNLASVCGHATTPGSCHQWIENNRAEAEETGWLVARNGVQLPSEVPYLHRIHGYGHALDNGLFERITHGPA